ncbi:MAG: hypothetical protein AAB403_12930 [Planctomycetota bacterium]
MTAHTFQGASSRDYTYLMLPWSQLQGIPRQAANYILAAGTPLSPEPVWISEAHRLYAFFEANPRLWDIAQAKHSARLFYIRAEPGQAARLAEREDLIRSYLPPMDDRVPPER